jgi:hypothetical protein
MIPIALIVRSNAQAFTSDHVNTRFHRELASLKENRLSCENGQLESQGIVCILFRRTPLLQAAVSRRCVTQAITVRELRSVVLF